MRGTLFDNEALRRNGIKEMHAAKATRLAAKKRSASRVSKGRPPIRPTAKQPWLRLSFLRQRPTPAPRNQSSTALVRRKPDARPKPHHRSSSSKSSKKSGSQGSKKRSASHKRSGKPPAKKGGKK